MAFAQLRSRWADEGRTPPTLLARKGKVLGSVVAGAPVNVSQLAGEIEWAKARLVGEKMPSAEFVTQEQIAALTVFLCGPNANQINGISLPVDGAWTAQ